MSSYVLCKLLVQAGNIRSRPRGRILSKRGTQEDNMSWRQWCDLCIL